MTNPFGLPDIILPRTERPVRRYPRRVSAFPQKRLVKFCTRRFRRDVTGLAADAITIRVDALSAAEEYVG